jgi:site-specific DNA recombinase
VSKAAIYIRWSTEDQGQGTTLDVQLEQCRQYCNRQGWYVPDDLVFIDDGYSGGNLHRPALTRLRSLVESGHVDTLVVYRLDRLSRNLADATSLVDREFKNRAVVRSATEEVYPEADEGWLNYSFRAAFADYERRIIRQRTMAGKLKRLRDGRKVHGRAPYGWRHTVKPGVLEIHPEEAEVVKQFFARCAYENMGAPALARWANRQGIPSPQGAKWHQGALRRLLQNPIYGGRILFGATRQLKSSKEESGPWIQSRSPDVEVEADPQSVPPIISRALWEMAQRVIETRTTNGTRGRGVSNPHLLSGFLYCRCGSRMGPKTAGAKGGSVYYRCYREAEVEPCPVQGGYHDATVLEANVEGHFLGLVGDPGARRRLLDKIAGQQQEDTALFQAELRQAEQELAQLEKELAFVDRQFRREEITIAEARRIRAGIEEEVRQVLGRQARAQERLAQAGNSRLRRSVALAQLDLTTKWELLTVLERKQVMRHFIQRIDAYRPRGGGAAEVTVTWLWGEALDLEVAQPVRRRNPVPVSQKGGDRRWAVPMS